MQLEQPTRMSEKNDALQKQGMTRKLNPCHIPFFLILILSSLLTALIQSPYETLYITLVSQAVLVLEARWCIIGDVYIAILAEIPFLRDPVLAHDGCLNKVHNTSKHPTPESGPAAVCRRSQLDPDRFRS